MTVTMTCDACFLCNLSNLRIPQLSLNPTTVSHLAPQLGLGLLLAIIWPTRGHIIDLKEEGQRDPASSQSCVDVPSSEGLNAALTSCAAGSRWLQALSLSQHIALDVIGASTALEGGASCLQTARNGTQSSRIGQSTTAKPKVTMPQWTPARHSVATELGAQKMRKAFQH